MVRFAPPDPTGPEAGHGLSPAACAAFLDLADTPAGTDPDVRRGLDAFNEESGRDEPGLLFASK